MNMVSYGGKPNKIGIIGVGNTFMGDDGIGCAVVEELKKKPLPKNIIVIDIGASIWNLVHILSKFDAVIMVDAVDFGGVPGETRCFSPEDISLRHTHSLSIHGSNLLDIIKISRELNENPKKIVIFGIQPATIVPSTELSLALKTKLSKITMEILEILRHVA